MNKTIALFGGSGGLGNQLFNIIKDDFNVISLNSNDVDVVDIMSVKEFFDINEIDIVINLSGYNYNNMLHSYENEIEIDNQININIKGNINILNGCLPHMREKKYGRIILMSSILSVKPVAGTSIYSGCKSFIDNLAKTCSLENLNCGITCNSIQLGYFDGGLTYTIPEKIRNDIKENIPLKRWGNIEELKNVIYFLIDTEYISGSNLLVNGGLL